LNDNVTAVIVCCYVAVVVALVSRNTVKIVSIVQKKKKKKNVPGTLPDPTLDDRIGTGCDNKNGEGERTRTGDVLVRFQSGGCSAFIDF
jgi:hypothetical protein